MQPVKSKMLLQYSLELAIEGSQILKQNWLEPMKLRKTISFCDIMNSCREKYTHLCHSMTCWKVLLLPLFEGNAFV